MKSPKRRLSIRVQPFRNVAKLRAFVISGERSAYIRLFSSKNATPDFGLALKRAAPVKISCFLDFACSNDSVEVNTEGHGDAALCCEGSQFIERENGMDNANIIGTCGHVIHERKQYF